MIFVRHRIELYSFQIYTNERKQKMKLYSIVIVDIKISQSYPLLPLEGVLKQDFKHAFNLNFNPRVFLFG